METSIRLVIPLGFEPKTHSLEGCCSIQLSYGTSASLVKCGCKGTKIFLNHNAILAIICKNTIDYGHNRDFVVTRRRTASV